MKLASFKVQSVSDTVVSIGATSINETVETLCNTPNSGYELECSDGSIFVTFAWDGVAIDMETTNYTASALPHHVDINNSLVGGRPDSRFKPKPTLP